VDDIRIGGIDSGYETSGVYTSRNYTANSSVAWIQSEIGGVSQPAGTDINVTFTVYNSTGAKEDSLTVTSVGDGTNNESLTSLPKTETIEYNLSMTSNGDSTATMDSISIYTKEPNTPPTVSTPVATPDPVNAGSTVNITANVSDPDGNLNATQCTLKDANGNIEADNVSMSTTSSDLYYCAYTPREEPSNIGDWTATVYANDTDGASTTNSSRFTVQELIPPRWRNLVDNVSTSLEINGTANISAEF
jgi:hypothetical protein